MADSSKWGINCKELIVQALSFFDIYHMQIMEGNLIQNIQENHTFYGHYHVAGVPGEMSLGTIKR